MSFKKYYLSGILLLLSVSIKAQDVQNSRRMSQRMEISRTIGTTKIDIIYHSPTAQGRKIIGGIVPYDFVVDGKEYPWRAGSNNRTTIEFQHDVTINGNKLVAGKYGLVVFVAENEWTFIFSNNTTWGAFQYASENDALRVKVNVAGNPHQEWLSYDFINPKTEGIDIELRWEKAHATFNVQTDVSENILSDLAKKKNKTTKDYRIMAIETLTKNPENIDSALEYLNKAISKIDEIEKDNMRQVEKFAINLLKADCLILKGEITKGQSLKESTIATAKGFDMYYYGLNTLIVKGDKEEAYELLTENIKNNPNQWQAYLSMGEYYIKDKNQEEAVKNFKRAFELAPDNWKNYADYLYLQNKLILENR